MADEKPQAGDLYRVREGFAVPGSDGFMRTYPAGALIDGGDKIATSHRAMLEPASSAVEQATAAPGERRRLTRLPSGRSLADVTQHREGHAHKTGAASARVPTNIDQHEGVPEMAHALPPEHPDSPASTFAPDQPGRGVVADDVPPEDAAGAERAADATVSDAKDGGGNVKAARAAAKVAKEVAKEDAERAAERQPDSGQN